MGAPNPLFFNEKKNSERFGQFLTLKIHLESPIFALCAELAKLGKASQDAYNPERWLILKAVLKNGVAEGVAPDPHDTSTHEEIYSINIFYVYC